MTCDLFILQTARASFIFIYVLFTFLYCGAVILLVITVTEMYPHMYVVCMWMYMHGTCTLVTDLGFADVPMNTHTKHKHVFAISFPSTGSQCLECLGDRLASYL